MSENNANLNQGFIMTMDESQVITVPIDTTLSREGQAADAAAVGAALDQKADADSVNNIDVNNQEADNQGHIILTGEHVPLSGTDDTTVQEAVEDLAGRNAETIPMSAAPGAPSIAEAMADIGGDTAENIPMSGSDSTTVAEKIAEIEESADAAVKSVNGVTADENGELVLNSVPLAANLTSDQSQAVTGGFTIRTTGGSRSVGNGPAQVQEIRGAMRHTGEVQEVLTWETEETSGITVDIDRDTFVEYVDESEVITIAYSSGWKIDGTAVDLEDYGITVDGTPNNGDTITINYVKEERGLITVATPTSFRATGWNLYNPATGYARVAGYDGRYHIGGTYTSISFSVTLNGERTALAVSNGSFSVPGNGYVWVTGGNATNTYITTEWTDWVNGPDVDWSAYEEAVINISAIMNSYFPDGLMAVGSVYDAINIDTGVAVNRIERIPYDEEDLADIIQEGRAYEADENFIYVVRSTVDTHAITITGAYTASDHGVEEIQGTEVAPVAVVLYGQNLKAKLVSDVVTWSAMQASEAQQKQARDNIGVTDLLNGAVVVESKVLYDNLTIAAAGYNEQTFSVAKTGYKPIGIVGYSASNGSTSGNGRTYVAYPKMYLSGSSVTVVTKNASTSSSIKVRCTVYIMYVKNNVFS